MKRRMQKLAKIMICASAALALYGVVYSTGQAEWFSWPPEPRAAREPLAQETAAPAVAIPASDMRSDMWAKLDALAALPYHPESEQPTLAAESIKPAMSSQPSKAASMSAGSVERFRITVYTPFCDGGVWGYKTSTGVTSRHLQTCAVDPSVIPLGSVIDINGLELVAVDIGSAVRGRVIDIFYDGTVPEAYEWVSAFGTRHDVEIVG